MPAWLADNSFSWSKLKKSITAVWKCNASTLEPHSATMRHQARGKGERRRVPSMCHIWLAQLQSLSRQPVTGNRAWKGPRAGMKLQISLAASTSLSLLHSAPSSYSFSHLHSPSLCHTHATHGELEIFQCNNGHLLPSAYCEVCSSLLAPLNMKSMCFMD